MRLVIDEFNFNDVLSLHQYLALNLNFPSYYGNNLDALYDVLLDINFKVELVFKNIFKYKSFLETCLEAARVNKNIKVTA